MKLHAVKFLVGLAFSVFAVNASAQSLMVSGKAGPSQLFAKVKAQRCDKLTRVCDPAVFFDLNTDTSVPAGTYILGFENSIYPGWVNVQPGMQTAISLQRLDIPAPLNGQAQVRVFRDFSNPIEMNKVLFTQFYIQRPFFHLGTYDFGDLYLVSSLQRSVTTRLSYDACAKIKLTSSPDPDVQEVINLCNAYKSARAPIDLAQFFEAHKVETDPNLHRKGGAAVDMRGKLTQTWIYFQNEGLKVRIRLERHLVSAPMAGSDFVAVFPGVYRILADNQPNSTTVQVVTPNIVESY